MSAHQGRNEAFHSVNLVDRLPENIESIETWENNLLVGTTSGTLIKFRVAEKPAPEKRNNISLEKSWRGWSKKPITQLCALTRHRVLVSICDGCIALHKLDKVEEKFHTLKNTKGCTCFAVDRTRPTLTICVGLKRKLLIYRLENHVMVEKKELSIPDVPKSLHWCGDAILVGLKKEYILVSAGSNATVEIAQNRSAVESSCLVPQDQVMLTKDGQSVFVNFDGKVGRRYRINWTETPAAVSYNFPFALAILGKDKGVEVRTAFSESTSFVQHIPLKGAKVIVVRDQDAHFAELDELPAADIFVAAQHHIWKLLPVPLFDQVDDLMRAEEFEAALTLCSNIPADKYRKQEKLRTINLMYGYHLFVKGDYQQSLKTFSSLECDPMLILGLYPHLLPRDYFKSENPYPVKVPELVGSELDRAYKALAEYIMTTRKAVLEKDRVENTGKEPDDFNDVTSVPVILDTALFKAYLSMNDAFVSQLLREENYCHTKQCEKLLLNHKKYKLLVDLYFSKGEHENALLVLRKLGNMKGSSAIALQGVRPTVQYLSKLDHVHKAIVFDFSVWVIREDPKAALGIFRDRSAPDELPPFEVLTFLKKNDGSMVIPYLEWVIDEFAKKSKRDIARKRRDGILGKTEVDPPSRVEVTLHDELAVQYMNTIQVLSKGSDLGPEVQNHGLVKETREKLLSFLSSSSVYTPEKMLSRFPQDGFYEERAILCSKVDRHEEALLIYAHKIKNFEKAEQYCKDNYNPDNEHARTVYLSLLRVYLQPGEGEEPMLEPALSLLTRYYGCMDTSKALSMLPPDLSVAHLQKFLKAVLRENTNKRRNSQVVHHLVKSENLQLHEQLIHAQSKVIRVSSDRNCPVCRKRLGTTVFACYPNDVVVHLKCHKDKNVCPVTGTRFDKLSNEC